MNDNWYDNSVFTEIPEAFEESYKSKMEELEASIQEASGELEEKFQRCMCLTKNAKTIHGKYHKAVAKRIEQHQEVLKEISSRYNQVKKYPSTNSELQSSSFEHSVEAHRLMAEFDVVVFLRMYHCLICVFLEDQSADEIHEKIEETMDFTIGALPSVGTIIQGLQLLKKQFTDEYRKRRISSASNTLNYINSYMLAIDTWNKSAEIVTNFELRTEPENAQQE